MATTLPKYVDGQVSFEKGVDTFQAPARIPRNQCALLINQTTRQDYVGPRPGWLQTPLRFVTYANGVFSPDPVVRADFENGLFQGMSAYVPDSGPSSLVLSISGKLFRANVLTDLTLQQIPFADPADPGNPPQRPQIYTCQAEQFLVIQDGQSKPLIYNGVTARRSDVQGTGGTDADGTPLYEVPVGTVMAYSNGRLWVALPDGRSFVAGDGVYGPSGTAAYRRRDSVMKFTENTYLNGGFAFAVPGNMGPISAMRSVANLDTSLGQGPLQVFTPSGCFSVAAPFDRTQWANVTYPIQTVSLLDQGALSQWATQLVNGDTWYRSLDGVRSFLIARRDFGTWGNRAMSYEVIRHLKDDDQTLLRYSSAALFDNRLLVTCAPQRDPLHGTFHRGLVALDFIPLTSLTGSEPPCWDGLWTGLDILQIVSFESEGVTYCYAAVLAAPNPQGQRKIQLWQLTRNQQFDMGANGTRTRVSRAMESPQLDFSPSGSNRLEQKLLESADVWIDKASGLIQFALYYRPDEHPCWYFWRKWQICAKTERCSTDALDGCVVNLNLKQQYRPRMGAGKPPDSIVPYTGLPSRLGYTFQYRLEITGFCEVVAVRLLATRIAEQTFGSTLPLDASCMEVICCEPNPFLGGPPTANSDTPPPVPPSPPIPPGPPQPPSPPGPPPPPVTPITPPVDNGPVTDYPNLPPHNIVPDPNLPPPSTPPGSVCGNIFYPLYETNTPGDPNGDFLEAGVAVLDDVEAGAMGAWAAAAWGKFSEFVATEHLTITAAQVQWLHAPTTGRRWQANQAFLEDFYFGAFGYDYTMVIYYCTPA